MSTLYPWSRMPLPYYTAIDDAGVTLPGAKLYFYASGTSTPLDTYANANHSVANANPVVADAGGQFASIFMQNLEYKVVLKDANDVEQWTADPVQPLFDDAAPTSFYDMPVFFSGKPAAGLIYPIFLPARSVRLPSTLTSSRFYINTNPTATMTFTFYKNTSTSIGTVAFSTAGVPTVTFSSNIDFTNGDRFHIAAPGSQDATGADIAMTFVWTIL